MALVERLGATRLRRALERSELKTLLRVGRSIDRTVSLVMYDLALRAGEVSKLRWSDVENDKIKVCRLKDGVDSWLRVDPATLYAVEAVTKNKKGTMLPWPQQRVRNWFRYLAKRAGLPPDKRYSHILRRSRATHMLADGATLQEIQWQLGHKSVQTTIIYLGITEETQQKARKVAAIGMEALLSRK